MPKVNETCRIIEFNDYKIVFKCRISPEWFMVLCDFVKNWKEVIFYNTNSARVNVFLIVKEKNEFIITNPRETEKDNNE